MDVPRPTRKRLVGRSLCRVVLTCVLFPATVLAQTIPPVLDACSAEPDGGKRLACYDREIARLHKLVPASAPAPTVDSTPSSPEASFGMTEALERNSGTQPKQLDELTGRITALSYKTSDKVIVTLENGQTWEQAEPEAHLALRSGDTVTIRRGMLGAFYMSSDRIHGLRVKRVR
jgi:hypothetical protein